MSTKKQLVWGDCFGYWRKDLMPTIKDHLAELSEEEKDSKVGFFFARMLCAASGKSIKTLKDENFGKATGALTEDQLQVLMRGMKRMKQYLKTHIAKDDDVDVADYIGEQCHRIKVDRLETAVKSGTVEESSRDSVAAEMVNEDRNVAKQMATLAVDSQYDLWKYHVIGVEDFIKTLRDVDQVIHSGN
jgi:hypothetical protein